MTTIHVQPTFDLGTRRQKEAESAEIAKDLAAFQRKGGTVQVIGNSTLRPDVTRRQVMQSGVKARKKGARS